MVASETQDAAVSLSDIDQTLDAITASRWLEIEAHAANAEPGRLFRIFDEEGGSPQSEGPEITRGTSVAPLKDDAVQGSRKINNACTRRWWVEDGSLRRVYERCMLALNTSDGRDRTRYGWSLYYRRGTLRCLRCALSLSLTKRERNAGVTRIEQPHGRLHQLNALCCNRAGQ